MTDTDLLYLSLSIVGIIGTIKFFTNKILSLILISIISFNFYYFVFMTEDNKLEVKKKMENVQAIGSEKFEKAKDRYNGD